MTDCHICGKPFSIDSAGIATHASATEPTGIDHDADADHVPFTLDDEDEDEGWANEALGDRHIEKLRGD